MKRFYLLALLCVWCYVLVAQVTSYPSPIPVGYTGEIVLTFDPTKGSGGMADATECYSHIGLITDKSKDIHDWKYIKYVDKWGTKEEPKWDKVGSNWQLKINNMFTYFGCPESETITAIVMVFHDGNGSSSKEGKATNGSDILIGIGEEIPADIWDNYNPSAVVEKARPSGVVNGIYYGADGTSVTLCTYAASKTEPAKHVFLIGDMTDWTIKNEYQLFKDGNYFWIKLEGLEEGKEYRFQYAVERADGVKKQISDLFSEKVLSPDDQFEPRSINPDLIEYPARGDGYVSIIQLGKPAFNWSNATLNFNRPDKNNLIIYEMWVYDHTPKRTFEGLMERLDYLRHLGINAVKLMPINEFDGNYSWGYNPNHYFALDKAYGTPEQFKTFVDECHKRGIAVIIEMSFNHATGNNPMNKLYPYTSSDATQTELRHNPWFNVAAPHPDNVFEDWNHGFAPTRDHFTRVLQYWLTEYKIDGYQMELSHGLCSDKPNTSVENLKYYYTNGVQAASPSAYFILEHWGTNMLTERQQLIEAGMMCLENTNSAFAQTAMGWLKYYDDFANANNDNYVSYSDAHYEERCFFRAKQWGNGNISSSEEARFARIPLNIGFQCMLNGPQLFYHFAEIGFDFSTFQKADGTWGRDGVDYYGEATATPSINEEVKHLKKARPENLGWFETGSRMNGYNRLGKILQLRTRLLPNVFAGNPTVVNVSSGLNVRTVRWGSDVYVVANFSATDNQTVYLPSGSIWYDYLDGNGKAKNSYTLLPGEIKVFTGRQLTTPNVPNSYKFEIDSTMITYNVNTQSLNPEMGQTSGDANVYTGTSVTISATPNAGYYFVQWSDGNTENPRSVVITQDTTFYAEFAPNTYWVSVESADYQLGMVTGSGEYSYGDVAILTATAYEGYQFSYWGDGNTDNPRYVSVIGNAYYTAYFGTKMCQLTVKPNDIYGGAVVGGGTFEYGSQVTIAASENSGYQFIKWSNGATYNPYKFTIVDNVELTAIFVKSQADNVDNVENVTIAPADNSVTIEWPTATDASVYEIVIKKGDVVFCTLSFNAQGQLLGIQFVRGRNGAHHSTASQQTATGWQFTITSLEAGTTYDYIVTAKKAGDAVVYSKSGVFTTTGTATGVDAVLGAESAPIKVMLNGQLYILRDGKMYSMQGQEVR